MAKQIKIRDLSDKFPINLSLGLNFDDPTPEETRNHQEIAMQIEDNQRVNELYEKHEIRGRARELLSYTPNISTNRQKVGWLRRAGYICACVKGGKMPLDIAPTNNVAAMYQTEITRLQKIAGQ